MIERRADLDTMAVEEHQRGFNSSMKGMHPHTAHRTISPAKEFGAEKEFMSNFVPKPTCQHTVRRSPSRTPEYKWEARSNTRRERLKPPRIGFEIAQRGPNRPPRIHLSENCRYIQNRPTVQVEINSLDNVCEECKIKHNLKPRPARKKAPKKVQMEAFSECSKPTLEEVTWLDSTLGEVTAQLQKLGAEAENVDGVVHLNATLTTRNATQTANTLHALSRCGSDVQVTLRTLPEHERTSETDHRCIMCPAKQAKEQGAKAIMLGCLLHVNGDTVAAAFDTLSEVSVVGPELITLDMQATPGVGVTPVYGVGNGSAQHGVCPYALASAYTKFSMFYA